MRAIRARYDPYEQSKGRVEQLRALGHSVDKVSFPLSCQGPANRDQSTHAGDNFGNKQVEFIIMGGTFMSLGESYRDEFMSQLHNSLSGYTGHSVDEAVRCVGCRLHVSALRQRVRRGLELMLRYLARTGTRNRPRRNVSESPSRRGQITASSLT